MKDGDIEKTCIISKTGCIEEYSSGDIVVLLQVDVLKIDDLLEVFVLETDLMEVTDGNHRLSANQVTNCPESQRFTGTA
jgi:hypothetical protein